jgi:hypothetical protein
MNFNIHCPCGKDVSVTEGAAGASFPCSCGRKISVPSLAQLRVQAGLPAVNLGPELTVQHLLAAGMLPGTRNCGVCGLDTDERIQVLSECETVWSRDNSSMLQFAAIFLFSPLFAMFARRHEGAEETHGRETSFTLPLPACTDCQKSLKHRKTLQAAFMRIPEYERLLRKFPETRLTILPATQSQ